jgi:hypothetical protein
VISLNGTTEKIQIVPGTAGAIDAQGDYVDLSGTTVTPGSSQIDGSAATSATDLIPAPAASTSRRVKYLGVRNTSTTVTTTMLVQKIATGPLTIELFKCVLLPGWELVYNGATWFVYDDKGAVVTGPTGGRYLRTTVLTAGTTFTTGVDTETIRIRMVGGGGGGRCGRCSWQQRRQHDIHGARCCHSYRSWRRRRPVGNRSNNAHCSSRRRWRCCCDKR